MHRFTRFFVWCVFVALVALGAAFGVGCSSPDDGNPLGTSRQATIAAPAGTDPPCCTTVNAPAGQGAAPTSNTFGANVDLNYAFGANAPTDTSGSYVTFSVTCATAPCGTPDGTIGTAPLLAESAPFFGQTVYNADLNITTIKVGTYNVVGVATLGSGDPTPAVMPTSFTYTVTQASTSVSLGMTQTSPTVYGQAVQLNATVNTTAALPGSVEFFDNGVSLGSQPATTTTPASLTISAPSVGSGHSYTAVFTSTDSTDYSVSPSSNAAPLTVNKADTTTDMLTSTSNPSLVLNGVIFSARVTANAPSTPEVTLGTTSKVRFDFGDTHSVDVALADSSGTATATTTVAHAYAESGTYTVTATYLGDGTNFKPTATAAMLSQVVNKDGTSTALPALSNTTSGTYGTDVTFTATVTSATGNNSDDFDTNSTVDFFYNSGTGAQALSTGCKVGNQTTVGTQKVVTATSTANCTTINKKIGDLPGLAPASSYTITATYNGDDGHTGATTGTLSGGFTITAQTPVITATSTPSTPNPSKFGQTVTLTAHVVEQTAGTTGGGTLRTNSGPAAPTGTVQFFESSDLVHPLVTTPTTAQILTDGSQNASVTISTLAAGTHTIVAKYTPAMSDYNYATASTSGAGDISQAVQPDPTTTVIISSANPGVVGVPLTFTVNVSANTPGVDLGGNSISGTPTGSVAPSVTIKDGTTTLGTATFKSNETWTFTTSIPVAGMHSITATYNTNTNFVTSTSTVLSQQIDATGTPAQITSSENPSTFGDSVTFTATLAPTTGGTPTGSVTFKDANASAQSDLATVNLTSQNGSAVATYATTSLIGGLHAVGFVYNGDTNHVAGGSATVAQTVNRAPTVTSLAVSPNPAAAGQSILLTANVSSSVGGTLGGTLTFKDGGAILATVPVSGGVASASTSALTAGTHQLTANYEGDNNFDVSVGTVALMVNKAATTMTLSSSSNPSTPASNVTFSAVVKSASGTVSGGVIFTDGSQTLGSATIGADGVASFRVGSLSEGPHAIHATFAETASFMASDATLTQIVSTTAATIAVSANPDPATFGAAVTITASLDAQTGTPSGSIVFSSDAGSLGNASIDAQGHASITTSTLPIGTTTITATYSGDGFFPPGTGTTTIQVSKGTSTTTLASSTNPATVGASVTFTATVSAGATGNVDFADNGTVIGSAALVSATATFTTSALAAGQHAITASYKGNDSYNASTSSPVTETINAATTTPNGGTSSSSSSGGAAGAGPTNTVTVGSGDSGCATTSASPKSALFNLLAVAGALGLIKRRKRR